VSFTADDGGGGPTFKDDTHTLNSDPKNPTAADWFGNNPMGKVSTSIPDMHTYAKDMAFAVGPNVATSASRASGNMGKYASSAFTGMADSGSLRQVPELSKVNAQQSQAMSDFGYFIKDLSNGITNIGMAAQVIADSYHGTDAFSAADLNSVDFAYGDMGANRPSGLNSKIGETTSERQADQQANMSEAQQADPENPNPYGLATVNSASGTGYSYITYTYPDGSTYSIMSGMNADGGSTTTVTTTDANGKAVSKNTTVESGNTSTEDDGQTKTVTVDNPDGSQTIKVEDENGKVLQETNVPAPSSSPDNGSANDGPAEQQMREAGNNHPSETYGMGY
jgi:hypothetical protein